MRTPKTLHKKKPDVLDPNQKLLSAGWIRIVNIENLDAWTRLTPSDAAWRAVADLLTTCILKGAKQDIEIPRILVSYRQQFGDKVLYSPADFIHQFGGSEIEQRLWTGLNTGQ